MKLSNNLKALRKLNGELSQQQLAEMVGCSRQTIISIESGCKNPSVELALKLSHALKTPLDQIFSLEEGQEKARFCQKVANFFKCRAKS
jgi:putative transcriptional regulator